MCKTNVAKQTTKTNFAKIAVFSKQKSCFVQPIQFKLNVYILFVSAVYTNVQYRLHQLKYNNFLA